MNSDKLILCVDDEKTVLDSLKGQLRSEFEGDYTLEFAESAEEALEVIEDAVDDDIKVLAVVSDWLMPEMKGDELLIKIHEMYPHIVKIMLTGQADKEAVDRAIEQAKLHKCLAKPWVKEELIATINSGLQLL